MLQGRKQLTLANDQKHYVPKFIPAGKNILIIRPVLGIGTPVLLEVFKGVKRSTARKVAEKAEMSPLFSRKVIQRRRFLHS